MAMKVRKQIYIEQEQDVRLKELSQQTGQSEAEIIREALERHTTSLPRVKSSMAAWEAELRYIDNLIKQGAVAGSRTWKREELYDR